MASNKDHIDQLNNAAAQPSVLPGETNQYYQQLIDYGNDTYAENANAVQDAAAANNVAAYNAYLENVNPYDPAMLAAAGQLAGIQNDYTRQQAYSQLRDDLTNYDASASNSYLNLIQAYQKQRLQERIDAAKAAKEAAAKAAASKPKTSSSSTQVVVTQPTQQTAATTPKPVQHTIPKPVDVAHNAMTGGNYVYDEGSNNSEQHMAGSVGLPKPKPHAPTSPTPTSEVAHNALGTDNYVYNEGSNNSESHMTTVVSLPQNNNTYTGTIYTPHFDIVEDDESYINVIWTPKEEAAINALTELSDSTIRNDYIGKISEYQALMEQYSKLFELSNFLDKFRADFEQTRDLAKNADYNKELRQSGEIAFMELYQQKSIEYQRLNKALSGKNVQELLSGMYSELQQYREALRRKGLYYSLSDIESDVSYLAEGGTLPEITGTEYDAYKAFTDGFVDGWDASSLTGLSKELYDVLNRVNVDYEYSASGIAERPIYSFSEKDIDWLKEHHFYTIVSDAMDNSFLYGTDAKQTFLYDVWNRMQGIVNNNSYYYDYFRYNRKALNDYQNVSDAPRNIIINKGEDKTGLSAFFKQYNNPTVATAQSTFTSSGVTDASNPLKQLCKAVGVPDDYIDKYTFDVMTEDDVKYINFCIGNGDTESARRYLKQLTEYGRALAAQEKANKYGVQQGDVDALNDGTATEKAVAAAKVALGIVRGRLYQLDHGVSTFFTGLGDLFAKEAKLTRTSEYLSAYLTDNLTQAGANETLAQVLDSGLVSTGRMIPSVVIGAATGGLATSLGVGGVGAGMASKAVAFVLEHAGTIAMGASSAGTAKMEALRNGATLSQATIYGVINGISETCLQEAMGGIVQLGGEGWLTRLSDGLINASNKPWVRAAVKQGLNILSEISEEEMQDFLDPIFRNIALGEHNNAFAQWDWKQAGMTLLSTALSTLLMNGATDMRGSYHGEVNIQRIADSTGLSIAEAREAYKTYGSIVSGNIGKLSIDDCQKFNLLVAKMVENLNKGDRATDTAEIAKKSLKTYDEIRQVVKAVGEEDAIAWLVAQGVSPKMAVELVGSVGLVMAGQLINSMTVYQNLADAYDKIKDAPKPKSGKPNTPAEQDTEASPNAYDDMAEHQTTEVEAPEVKLTVRYTKGGTVDIVGYDADANAFIDTNGNAVDPNSLVKIGRRLAETLEDYDGAENRIMAVYNPDYNIDKFVSEVRRNFDAVQNNRDAAFEYNANSPIPQDVQQQLFDIAQSRYINGEIEQPSRVNNATATTNDTVEQTNEAVTPASQSEQTEDTAKQTESETTEESAEAEDEAEQAEPTEADIKALRKAAENAPVSYTDGKLNIVTADGKQIDYDSLNKTQRRNYDAAKAASEAFDSIAIVLHTNLADVGVGGFYKASDNSLHISLNGQQPAYTIIAHEMIHAAKSNDSTIYNAIHDTLRKHFSKARIEAAEQTVRQYYPDADSDLFVEEVDARLAEQVFTNEHYLNEIIEDKSNGARTLIDIIRDLVTRFTNAFKDRKQIPKKLIQAQSILAGAFEYIGNESARGGLGIENEQTSMELNGETAADTDILWTAPKDYHGWMDEYATSMEATVAALKATDAELYNAYVQEGKDNNGKVFTRAEAKAQQAFAVMDAVIAANEDVRQATVSPMAAMQYLSEVYKKSGKDGLVALIKQDGNLKDDALEAVKAIDQQHNEAQTDGGVKYRIAYDTDGKPFVVVEENILANKDGKPLARFLKEYLRDKFDGTIKANGQSIRAIDDTVGEWVYSEYSRKLSRKNKTQQKDKNRAIAYADEILQSANDWINEEPKHDSYDQFARGHVRFKFGNRGYSAEVVVGIIDSTGEAVLHDLVNLNSINIVEAPRSRQSRDSEKGRQGTSTNGIIPQESAKSKTEENISSDKEQKSDTKHSFDTLPDALSTIESDGVTEAVNDYYMQLAQDEAWKNEDIRYRYDFIPADEVMPDTEQTTETVNAIGNIKSDFMQGDTVNAEKIGKVADTFAKDYRDTVSGEDLTPMLTEFAERAKADPEWAASSEGLYSLYDELLTVIDQHNLADHAEWDRIAPLRKALRNIKLTDEQRQALRANLGQNWRSTVNRVFKIRNDGEDIRTIVNNMVKQGVLGKDIIDSDLSDADLALAVFDFVQAAQPSAKINGETFTLEQLAMIEAERMRENLVDLSEQQSAIDLESANATITDERRRASKAEAQMQLTERTKNRTRADLIRDTFVNQNSKAMQEWRDTINTKIAELTDAIATARDNGDAPSTIANLEKQLRAWEYRYNHANELGLQRQKLTTYKQMQRDLAQRRDAIKRINKVMGRLRTFTLRPTKDNHIPEQFRDDVAKLLHTLGGLEIVTDERNIFMQNARENFAKAEQDLANARAEYQQARFDKAMEYLVREGIIEQDAVPDMLTEKSAVAGVRAMLGDRADELLPRVTSAISGNADIQKASDNITAAREALKDAQKALDAAWDEGARLSVNDAANTIQGIIEGIESRDDSSVSLAPGLSDTVKALANKPKLKARNEVIAALSTNDILNLANVVDSLYHSIIFSNKLFATEQAAYIADIGEEVRDLFNTHYINGKSDLRNIAGNDTLSKLQDTFTTDNMTPTYFAEFLGGKDTALGRVLMETEPANNTHQSYIKELVDYLAARADIGDNLNRLRTTYVPVTLTIRGGKRTADVQISRATLMDLYLLSKRPHARDNLLNTLNGGIYFTSKDDAKIDSKKADEWKFTLDEEQLDSLVGELTDEERDMADYLQKFTNRCAEWGNKVSMQLWGIKLFNDENYWQMKVSDSVLAKSQQEMTQTNNGQAIAVALKNGGVTKAVQEGARNPLRVQSVFDSLAEHVTFMAAYGAYVPVLEDMSRVYNYKFINSEKGNNNSEVLSVHDAISRLYGSGATKYWQFFTQKLNGVSMSRDYANAPFFEKAYSRIIKAKVWANMRVVIQQPVAIARTLAYIDPQHFAHGMEYNALHARQVAQEANEYWAAYWWKSNGNREIHQSKSMYSVIYGKTKNTGIKGVGEKISEAGMAPAGFADQITWGAIWQACKYQVMKQNPEWKNAKKGTDEYAALMKATQEFADYVVNRTQVTDDVLHRSLNMSSGNFLVKASTAYMSEPTMTQNMLALANLKLRRANKFGTATEKAEARKHWARVGAAFVLNASVLALVTGLFDALRDRDKKKKLLERIKAHGLANLIDELNPAGRLPYIKSFELVASGKVDPVQLLKDIASGDFAEDWSSRKDDFGLGGAIWKTFKTYVSDGFSNVGESVFSIVPDAINYIGKALSADNAWTRFYAIAQLSEFTGFGIKNAYRDVLSVINEIYAANHDGDIYADYASSGFKSKTQSQYVSELYDAIKSGDADAVSQITDKIISKYDGVKDESGIQSLLVSYLAGYAEDDNGVKTYNDQRIVDMATAKDAGDMDEYNRLLGELVQQGFDSDTVVAAVNRVCNTTYTKYANELYSAMISGDTEAVSEAMDKWRNYSYNGTSDEEITDYFAKYLAKTDSRIGDMVAARVAGETDELERLYADMREQGLDDALLLKAESAFTGLSTSKDKFYDKNDAAIYAYNGDFEGYNKVREYLLDYGEDYQNLAHSVIGDADVKAQYVNMPVAERAKFRANLERIVNDAVRKNNEDDADWAAKQLAILDYYDRLAAQIAKTGWSEDEFNIFAETLEGEKVIGEDGFVTITAKDDEINNLINALNSGVISDKQALALWTNSFESGTTKETDTAEHNINTLGVSAKTFLQWQLTQKGLEWGDDAQVEKINYALTHSKSAKEQQMMLNSFGFTDFSATTYAALKTKATGSAAYNGLTKDEQEAILREVTFVQGGHYKETSNEAIRCEKFAYALAGSPSSSNAAYAMIRGESIRRGFINAGDNAVDIDHDGDIDKKASQLAYLKAQFNGQITAQYWLMVCILVSSLSKAEKSAIKQAIKTLNAEQQTYFNETFGSKLD